MGESGSVINPDRPGPAGLFCGTIGGTADPTETILQAAGSYKLKSISVPTEFFLLVN